MESKAGSIECKNGRRWALAIGLMAALILAAGCSSTPPEVEEEEITEQPTESEEDDDAQEESEADEEGDGEPSADEDHEFDGEEEVDEHVDGRIKQAMDDARNGDVESAREALEGLREERQGGFVAAYNLGVLAEQQGDIEAAENLYGEALRRHHDFTPALINMIRMNLRQDNVDRAREIADAWVDARPDNLDHQAARLEIALHQGLYEDVVEGARDLLRRDVEQVEAMLQMATAMQRLERYELARAILVRANQVSPDRAEVFFILGQGAWHQDNHDQARVNFRQALELNPHFAEARNNYAVLLIDSGNFDRAVEQLELALKDEPLYAEAHVNLGNAHKAMGNYEEALSAFEEALAINDSHQAALFNLGILFLEAPVPDMDLIERNEAASATFQEFRNAVGERRANEKSVDNFINEAQATIDREEQRQEALREAQAGGDDEPEPDDDGDDDGDSDDDS